MPHSRFSLFPSTVLASLAVALSTINPAWAGQIMSWRFDPTTNRLEFTTSEGIQPQAQLIPNPTRIVLDVPNTTLGRPRVEQNLNGLVQAVRIGQFTPDTTRFVIELAPGYTVNPQQIRIQGLSPTQWIVELPTPEALTPSAPPAVTPPTSAPIAPSPTPTPAQGTQLEALQQTPDGLFLRTSGPTPRINFRRSRDRRSLELDILNTSLSPTFQVPSDGIPALGIERIEVDPPSPTSPQVRLKLRLARNPANWLASASNLGGIVLLPQGTGSRAPSPSPSPSTPTPSPSPVVNPPVNPTINQVQAVDFNAAENQLWIQTSGTMNYAGQWVSGEYRITLSPAQLAPNVRGPVLGSDSPLLRVRLRQQDPQTVVIVTQPSSSVQVEPLRPVNDRLLILPLAPTNTPITVPPPRYPDTPQNPSIPPTNPTTSLPNPGTPRGREVVVIDPGHGGPDPGAIGIGGIQEKRLVMEMSTQVARLLEQQGVQVILTRTGDYDLDLEPRVAMANRANATVFVSIHANAISMSRPEVNGLETYYYSEAGRRLADTIHRRILSLIPMGDRGVRQARFYVLRHTDMPASLVETGFVTGAQDAARLSDPAWRQQMAAAIAQGILDYLR